jgi:DNA repair protein RadC
LTRRPHAPCARNVVNFTFGDDAMTHTLLIRDAEQQLREATATEVLDRAASLIAERFHRGTPVLADPQLTRQYLRVEIGALPYQVFGVLLLDSRRRLIRTEVLFRGTIDAVSVHPREIARVVVASDAAAVLLFRNARASIPEPTEADALVLRHVRQALALIDACAFDYLLIGTETEYSFAEAGQL